MADAALMRLQAKTAKQSQNSESKEIAVAAKIEPPVPSPPPQTIADLAAQLEAALKGHLETVAAALESSAPAADPPPLASAEPVAPPVAPSQTNDREPTPSRLLSPFAPEKSTPEISAPFLPERPAASDRPRSKYAPDPNLKGERIGLRLPRATPFNTAPLPELPPAIAAEIVDDVVGRSSCRDDDDVEDYVDVETYPVEEDDRPEGAIDFRHDREPAPPVARPRATARHADHRPRQPRGISPAALAFASLFGLAVGIGAIAVYQYLAPVPAPVVATAPILPMEDTSKVVKTDADRVPQREVATAAATASPDDSPAAASQKLAAGHTPAGDQPAGTATASADDPALEEGGPIAAGDTSAGAVAAAVPPVDVGPLKTGMGTASPSPAKGVAQPEIATPVSPSSADQTDHQLLAYAQSPPPDDPVAKSLLNDEDNEPAPSPPPRETPPKKASKAVGSGSLAKVTTHVNMRSKATNDAPSVKVLAAGSTVRVVQCDYWCEVVADGKHGYVYRRFLSR